MVEVLRSKRASSKFQILVEIAARQPNVRQKDIAEKLDITPQAVSEYIKKLAEEKMITISRGKYRITKEGVDFILRMTNELNEYSSYINNVVTNISVWAAVADDDLREGERAILKMRDGILYAQKVTPENLREDNASAICVSDATKGEDVGVKNIEGTIKMELGKITVCRIPRIQNGGSRNVDLERLRKEIEEKDKAIVCAIGIEALVALSRINITPEIKYGVKEAVIEASSKGLSLFVACVEDEIPSLLHRLEHEGFNYELLDIRKG